MAHSSPVLHQLRSGTVGRLPVPAGGSARPFSSGAGSTVADLDFRAIERFWSKVDQDGPCWLWTAGCTSRGYGAFTANSRQRLAHRVAYQLLIGPIPQGLTLDHLCRRRNCVRPDHLEPVPAGVNVLRGKGITAKNASKERCPRGHPYDLVSSGKRRCLRCKRERYHERKHA